MLLAVLLGFGSLHAPVSAGDVDARGFLRALVAGLFAFGGWHMVTYTAEETNDPRRTIPMALLIGTPVVTAAYVALNAVYLYVLPLDRVIASNRVAAEAAAAVVGQGSGAVIAALVVVFLFYGATVVTAVRAIDASSKASAAASATEGWLSSADSTSKGPMR